MLQLLATFALVHGTNCVVYIRCNLTNELYESAKNVSNVTEAEFRSGNMTMKELCPFGFVQRERGRSKCDRSCSVRDETCDSIQSILCECISENRRDTCNEQFLYNFKLYGGILWGVGWLLFPLTIWGAKRIDNWRLLYLCVCAAIGCFFGGPVFVILGFTWTPPAYWEC